MELLSPAALFHALSELTCILFIVAVVKAQQFEDALLGNHAYPGLSEPCAEALNTTVKDCPIFLASASATMPRLDSSSLDKLCTSVCRASLTSVREVIASGCRAETDVMEIRSVVYPATFVIDRFLYTYDISCAKDSDTGRFCDEIYIEGLANGTAADSCSDCSLGVVRAQLNSPFGYHAQFARGFESITSKCSATGYAFTSPAKYAISTKPDIAPTEAPTCGSPYVVQDRDTCDSIAAAKNVSTHSVNIAGGTGPDCSNLKVGAKLCLPQEPCTLYQVQYDDTCESILAAVSGLRPSDLLTWNPNINPLCTNLDTLFDKFICISPPGRTLDEVTSTTITPTTTEPPPTVVPRPTNAKQESHTRCGGWYEVQDGDYCQALSIRHGISLRDLHFLNPSIDIPDCAKLWLETAYCVKPVGNINTYSGYPYSTSPIYTITSSDYETTTVPLVKTVKPIATPIVELPLAPGSLTEGQGCLEFANHRVVVPRRVQFVQSDVPAFTDNVNSCDFVSASFEVALSDFLAWNPSLQGLDPCQLQNGYRYCGIHSNGTADPPANDTCIEVTEPCPGTVPSCSCFTIINGYNADLYGCEDIAHDHEITVSDLVSWNSWIGLESNCDTGIYANLTGVDERPVCIGVGGSRAIPSNTTLSPAIPTPTTTPTPT